MLPSARHLLQAGAICALSYAVYDPARICLYALALRTMQRQHPQMFDSALAAEQVTLAIAEQLALEQPSNILQAA